MVRHDFPIFVFFFLVCFMFIFFLHYFWSILSECIFSSEPPSHRTTARNGIALCSFLRILSVYCLPSLFGTSHSQPFHTYHFLQCLWTPLIFTLPSFRSPPSSMFCDTANVWTQTCRMMQMHEWCNESSSSLGRNLARCIQAMRGAEQQLRSAEVQPGFGSQVLFCGSIYGDPWTFWEKCSWHLTLVAFESLLCRFGLVLLELLRSGSVDTSARTACFNTVPTSRILRGIDCIGSCTVLPELAS